MVLAMAEGPVVTFRRILVGIDASRASLDALAAAATVAARLGSDLSGLFVEDEDVLRLAALPFAGIVRVPSGERAALDRQAMEAELRALAARARETLAREAAGRRVGFTFRVVRGRVVAEVLSASRDADLLVLGTGGHGRSGHGGVGATARAAAFEATSSVLLLRRGGHLGDPVVAVDDGGDASTRVIAVARAFAGGAGPTILEARVGDAVAVAEVLARIRPLLVVVAASGRFGGHGALDVILSSGPAVLLVR